MAKRTKIALSKRRLRSAISNGTHVLADVDHRGPHMRRLRDLISDHTSDLGGNDAISHSERVLISRASMLTLLTEMQEARFIAKPDAIPPCEFQSYCWTISGLTRILVALGLQRRALPVEDLQTYIRRKAQRDNEDDADDGETAE